MSAFSCCGDTTVDAHKFAKKQFVITYSVKAIDIQFCLFGDSIHKIQACWRTVANFT